MVILSYHNVRVPFPSAHSLYTVQTSIDLSRLGEVFFYANKGLEQPDFKTLYDADPAEYPCFHLRASTSGHKGLAGLQKRLAVLSDMKARKGEKTIVYATQVKPLKFFLFLKKAGFKFKILLEPHSESEPWSHESFRSADGIVFTSKALQNRLAGQFSIPSGIPQRVFHHRIRRPLSGTLPAPVSGRRDYCIGYIGGLEAWKGVDSIVEALQFLPENVNALFIGGESGSADHKRLMSRAREADVEKRIRHTEHVPCASLAAAAQEADAFILPLLRSEEGSLPMKLFDYMSFGKPIIAAEQESIREVLEERTSALFFPPGSARGLSEQIRAVMKDPLLGSRLAANAYNALQFHTVERWLDEMKAFLEKI